MADSLDPYSARVSRMTDAYMTGIAIHDDLRDGKSLSAAVSDAVIRIETLDDAYPDWHPAPDSFCGMLRLFLYREITGDSYRSLAQYQKFADAFGLDHIPDKSVLSRTWRNRFDDEVREFVTIAAHFVVKEVHDHGPAIAAVRPKEEVVNAGNESAGDNEDESTADREFTDEQIHRTTRLAREHGFDGFDSGRAVNATYGDAQFFELQTFMGMVGCGTAQGAARFQFRRGEEYGPHGDTHLRVVKQFEPNDLIDGFNAASDRLLSAIASEVTFQRPVTVAIDITTVPYYGDVEGMPMVSGLTPEDRVFKFATLSIVGKNIPLVLAVEPVRESSAWDGDILPALKGGASRTAQVAVPVNSEGWEPKVPDRRQWQCHATDTRPVWVARYPVVLCRSARSAHCFGFDSRRGKHRVNCQFSAHSPQYTALDCKTTESHERERETMTALYPRPEGRGFSACNPDNLDFGFIKANDQYADWHASTPLLPMVRAMFLKQIEDYSFTELHR